MAILTKSFGGVKIIYLIFIYLIIVINVIKVHNLVFKSTWLFLFIKLIVLKLYLI